MITLRARAAALVALLATTGSLALAQPVRALDCSPYDDICNALVDAQNQQAAEKRQLAEIQTKIKDTEQQMKALNAYIASLNQQVISQQAVIDKTAADIDELDRSVRMTEADITRRQAHLEVRQELFGQRVRSMDKHGSINYLALVLSAASFNQLIDRIVLTQQIVQSDHRFITDLEAEKTRIQALKDSLVSRRAEEAQLLDQQKTAKAHLVAVRAAQQDAYAYQAQLESQYKKQADDMARAIADAADQVKQLQAAYDAEAAASGGGTGVFGWPENPHWLSQGFGCSPYQFEMYWPSCPSKHFHSGIDLAQPPGTPVLAADNGVAAVYSTRYGYGNYVILTHGNGYATLYGHLASFTVRNGQLVYRGQVIAYEGSTGNSTGPHLHFEIRYNGEYRNPCAWLGC